MPERLVGFVVKEIPKGAMRFLTVFSGFHAVFSGFPVLWPGLQAVGSAEFFSKGNCRHTRSMVADAFFAG